MLVVAIGAAIAYIYSQIQAFKEIDKKATESTKQTNTDMTKSLDATGKTIVDKIKNIEDPEKRKQAIDEQIAMKR